MTNEYKKPVWSMEDTIENIKEVKEHLKRIVKETNLHGKGEEDAKEIDFDFDRAIKSLEKQIPKKPKKLEYEPLIKAGWEFECPKCESAVGENRYDIDLTQEDDYCPTCGQKLDWSE